MSTGTKRPWRQAMEDAEAFRNFFAGCVEDWCIAGSLRRKRPEVGDCEHVVRPCFAQVASGDLFGGTETVNLLWQRLDELVASGEVRQHVYLNQCEDGTERPTVRWGLKYRGVEWRNFTHEIFTATPEAWGLQVAIRTGPPELSQRLVTMLKAGGMYRAQDGVVVVVKTGEVAPVRTEEAFFSLCGVPWSEPEDRS